MSVKSQVTCWVVSDGKAGMENQCIGVAEAMGLTPVVKRIKLKCPWRQLSPFLRRGLSHAFSPEGDTIAPPWPDLLIASGRASVMASLYVRRAAAAEGKRTVTVQIQNPMIDPSYFDLLVVPRHDGLMGPNVMTTRGSMHRVTPERLRREALAFQSHFAHLPRPLVSVAIGGSSAVYHLNTREMRDIVAKLRALVATSGAGLMITPSRRTGEPNIAILREGLKDLPVFIWDGQGDNPYYGMLGLADAILVTCESTNMVSEACSTGKPVYVIDLPGGSGKFYRFHQTLRDDGLIRLFEGRLEQWSSTPLNDVQLVAARVTRLLEERN